MQSCPFVYILSVAAFALEIMWATRLKIFTSWSSTENICDSWLRGSKILCLAQFPDQNNGDIYVDLVQLKIFFCVWKSGILKCEVTIALIYCELIMIQVFCSALYIDYLTESSQRSCYHGFHVTNEESAALRA